MITTIKNDHNVLSIKYMGDIHMDIRMILNRTDLKDCVIIHVGDFGLGLISKSNIQLLNNYLIKNNVWIYVVRGNHENHNVFNNTYISTNIFAVQDYTILELTIGNIVKRIFCLGGSISINRVQKRLVGQWFKNEIMNFNYTDEIDKIRDIDVIVTHNAPIGLPPVKMSNIVYFFEKNDKNLINELNQERTNLKTLIDKIISLNKDTLREYYYGHFHYSNIIFHDNITYKLLNIGEISE